MLTFFIFIILYQCNRMFLTRDLLPIKGWGFYFMNKVNFYIDGFNIYHAIDKMKDNKYKTFRIFIVRFFISKKYYFR